MEADRDREQSGVEALGEHVKQARSILEDEQARKAEKKAREAQREADRKQKAAQREEEKKAKEAAREAEKKAREEAKKNKQ